MGREGGSDLAPAAGRAPLLGSPESNSLLYREVAMKAAGLSLDGPCSLFAEARRFAIRLSRNMERLAGWRPMGFAGDVLFRPCRLPGQAVC